MAEAQKLTAAQRAANFAAATRQNFHMLPSQTTTQAGTTMQFTYPKSRLLSKTFLKVEGTVTYTNTKVPVVKDDIYGIFRRVALSLNNGFDPFVVSGKELAAINSVRMNPAVIYNELIKSKTDESGKKVSFSFMLELENTLNQRDASSLILLQNESTQVTLSVDITSDIENDLFTGQGVKCTLDSVTVTPCILTYTIPNFQEGFPDLSVIKLVHSRTETLTNAGQHILKLETGRIYRKIVLRTFDRNGNKSNELLKGNIEMLYNTADTPQSIDADALRLKNASDFGYMFLDGTYVFDFSGYSGFSNYGGTRDFVDTERLSEFWIRLNTTESSVRVNVIYETLARLS